MFPRFGWIRIAVVILTVTELAWAGPPPMWLRQSSAPLAGSFALLTMLLGQVGYRQYQEHKADQAIDRLAAAAAQRHAQASLEVPEVVAAPPPLPTAPPPAPPPPMSANTPPPTRMVPTMGLTQDMPTSVMPAFPSPAPSSNSEGLNASGAMKWTDMVATLRAAKEAPTPKAPSSGGNNSAAWENMLKKTAANSDDTTGTLPPTPEPRRDEDDSLPHVAPAPRRAISLDMGSAPKPTEE